MNDKSIIVPAYVYRLTIKKINLHRILNNFETRKKHLLSNNDYNVLTTHA